MSFDLHAHHDEALAMLRASLLAGKKHPMLQAVTGFGKTILAAKIVEGALAKGKRVLFTTVFVFGDNYASNTGQAVAYGLAQRLKAKGLDVVVEIPSVTGQDWNDVLLRKMEGGTMMVRPLPVLMRQDEVTGIKGAINRSGKSEATIRRLCRRHGLARQTSPSAPLEISADTGEKLAQALEAAGVIFIAKNGDGPGVRLQKKR